VKATTEGATHRRSRQPRHRSRVAAARVLLAALVAGLVFAAAPAAQAEMVFTVDIGYEGQAVPGRPYPVRVILFTEELISGELRVRALNAGSVTTTQKVEVAGGSQRELWFVMDSSMWDSPAVEADLIVDGEVVAHASAQAVDFPDTDLVGIFPTLSWEAFPERSSLAAESGTAELFKFKPERLALGAGALGPVAGLVMNVSDLRALDATSVDALLGWVGQGGTLYVDAPLGEDLPGVPSEWQPHTRERRDAGLGEIRLTRGQAGRGAWEEFLVPGSVLSLRDAETFGEMMGFWGGQNMSTALAVDAGFSLPGVFWLIGLLIAYVAVVGPVTWFVLRRLRRPSLAWATIPVAALVFTAGLWALGSAFRDNVDSAHATLIEVSPRGTTATSYLLVDAREGTREKIELPSGWRLVTPIADGRPLQVRSESTADGSEIELALDTGGYAVMGRSGSAPEFDDGLAVRAIADADGVLQGTVTNRMEIDLHEVAVFADLAATNIGTLPAGATVEFELGASVANPWRGEPAEMKVWRSALGPEWGGAPNSFEPGPVNLTLWTELNQRTAVNSRPVGQVLVAGWTPDLAAPRSPSFDTGRTLFVARNDISTSSSSAATNLSVGRRMVRGPSGLGSDFRLGFDDWGGGAMMRFNVDDDYRDLVIDVPRDQRRIDLWVDGSWEPLDVAAGTAETMALPGAAIDAGEVYIRALFRFEEGPPDFRALAVRSRVDGEDVAAFAIAPETEEATG
jgi:hypothetical protein